MVKPSNESRIRAVLESSGTVDFSPCDGEQASSESGQDSLVLIVSGKWIEGGGPCCFKDLFWSESLNIIGAEGPASFFEVLKESKGEPFLSSLLDQVNFRKTKGDVIDLEQVDAPLMEGTERIMNNWRNQWVRQWVEAGDGEGLLEAIRIRQKSIEEARNEYLKKESEQLVLMRQYGKTFLWLTHFENKWKASESNDWRIPLESALAGRKAITLDIWDTLLYRKVAEPKDVFRLVGLRWRSRLGFSAEVFCKYRVDAEQAVRLEWQEQGKGEDIPLDCIYQALGATLSLDSDALQSIQEDELTMEAKLIYGNRELIETLSNDWSRVRCCISEMYLAGDLLSEWIELQAGVKQTVYVSGEVGLSKGSGRLFEHVLKVEDLRPEDVLHIGDNVESDIGSASRLGMNTYHWVYHPKGFIDELSDNRSFADLESRVCLGLARWHRQQCSEIPERIGFELFGPLLWAYLNWLKRQTSYNEADRVWFLARDGYYLEKGLEVLPLSYRPEGQVDYVFASRKMLGLAAMETIEAEDWDFLLKAAPGLTAGDFFRRIGMEPEMFADRFEAHGLRSIDERLTWRDGYLDNEDRNRLYHLFVEQIESFHAVRVEHREVVLDYLKTKLNAGDKAVAIDLGWHGSSLKALSRIFKQMGSSLEAGYYFATWGAARELECKEISFSSFFTHLGSPESRVQVLEESIPLIEFLFSAPHGSITGLSRAGTTFNPLVEDAADGPESVLRERIWTGAMTFLREIGALFEDPSEGDPFAYLEATLERLLRYPKKEEVVLFRGLQHAEGWGLNRSQPVLPEVPENATDFELVQLLMQSGWPNGWLTMCSEAERSRMKAFWER